MLGGLGYVNALDIQGSNYCLRELKIKDASKTSVSFIAGGHFVIKENITSSREVEKDDEDSSDARPLKMYETCLKQTGFRIVKLAR
ncbi:alpha N-terminal protein methyltransferase 1-like [Glossina fuscipes fuscipes]